MVVRSCKSAWPRGAVAGTKGCTIFIPSDKRQMARAVGMQNSVLWGAPGYPFRLISILMTRLRRWPLEKSCDPLKVDEEGPWLDELGRCSHAMRAWRSPFNRKCHNLAVTR